MELRKLKTPDMLIAKGLLSKYERSIARFRIRDKTRYLEKIADIHIVWTHVHV